MTAHTAARAQTPAAATSLPIGTPLTVIAEQTVDAHVRPFSVFRVHLRDPLTLSRTLVAIAGTPARLVVTSKDVTPMGITRFHISIIGLNLGVAGTLPVRPDVPVVDGIAAGMPIAVTTLAAVAYDDGKVRVEIPLPFKLSAEPPSAGYTPPPLRTAAPFVPRRRPTPKPSAVPTPSPADSPLPGQTPPATSASPPGGPLGTTPTPPASTPPAPS